MTLILISSSTVAAEEEVGFRDGAIIFGTGVAIQVSAVGQLLMDRRAPNQWLPSLSSAPGSYGHRWRPLGHNGNMFWTAAATYLGSLAGARSAGGCKQRRK